MPQTKEDIIGWGSKTDNNHGDDDEDDEEEHVQHNLKVQRLPTTAKELHNRCKVLHCQFLHHAKV